MINSKEYNECFGEDTVPYERFLTPADRNCRRISGLRRPLDAASLAESDAERANRNRRHGEPKAVPLYTKHDVHAAMKLVRPMPYDRREQILDEAQRLFLRHGLDGGRCALDRLRAGRGRSPHHFA